MLVRTPFRLSKILLVIALALQVSLVAFGNMTDYGTNFEYVKHVMSMDTLFPGTSITYRAITTTWMHHAAYLLIIAVETLIALLCWAGAWRMWHSRHASGAQFDQAKGLAVLGISLGLLLWLAGFMAMGGEWFGMWMSAHWNGVATAAHLVLILLAALIYLGQREAGQEN